MDWIDESIDAYCRWLRENTSHRTDGMTGWSVISTPFTGLFNDSIEIYVKKEGGLILMSDDGSTLSGLSLSGVDVNRSSLRRSWLDSVLLNYGLDLKDGEIVTRATAMTFAQKKHNMICAISEISDMELTATHTVSSMFREDVRSFLDEQEIIYTPQFIAKGSTGIEFTFDFQIAGRGREIVIKSFNTLNRTNVLNFLFGWNDIREQRVKITNKEIVGLAFINDIDREVRDEYVAAMESKGTRCVMWSGRHKPDNLRKLDVA